MPPTKGKKNPRMARLGKVNPKWKDGRSSDYQRRIKNAKKGELVHHKDHNRSHNAKSNLQVLKPGIAKTSTGVKRVTAIGKHNLKHREKGRK